MNSNTTESILRLRLFFCSILIAIVVCPSSGFAQPSGPIANRYPVNGDLNKNRFTDLEDLCLLGASWTNSLDRYALKNTSALDDISFNWRKVVPATLASQAEFASFNTDLVANPDPSTKMLSVDQKKAYIKGLSSEVLNSKAVEGPIAIGFALDIPVKGRPEVLPREQVFNVLDDQGQLLLVSNTTFTQVPRGGFQEDSAALGLTIPRYTVGLFNADFPVQSTEFVYDSIESAFEEANVLNLDVGVAARYASFTGSLDLGIDNEFYADRRNFKLILLIRQSFGWRYMPSDLIEANLTNDFRNRRDQALIDTDIDLTEEYGTFVATADHKVRSIALTITVKTEKEEDRDAFSAKLKTAFGGFGGSFSLDAALSTLKSTTTEIRDIRIDSSVVGGPALIDLSTGTEGEGEGEGETSPNFVPLESTAIQIANDATLGIPVGERLSQLVSAWIKAGNITNAASVDFVYSPVANFQRVDRNPLTKGASMRAWFKRYLECDEALARANAILTSADRVPEEGSVPSADDIFLRAEYSYLASIKPFTPPFIPGGDFTFGTFPTYRAYAANQYLDTVQLYFDLFEKGRKISDSTTEAPEIFRPAEPFYLVPDFTSPTFSLSLGVTGVQTTTQAGISCNGSAYDPTYCGQCLQGRYQLTVNGIELRSQNRFNLVFDFNPGSTATPLPPCDAGEFAPKGVVFSRESTDPFYTAVRYARGNSNNCYIGCFGQWDFAYAGLNVGGGMQIGLFDTTTQRIVTAVGIAAGSVVPLGKDERESLKNSAFSLPASL